VGKPQVIEIVHGGTGRHGGRDLGIAQRSRPYRAVSVELFVALSSPRLVLQ
jgi:hypothetical protein